MKDGTRASEIIKRIRLLFKKRTPERELVDINEIIREMMILLRSEAMRYSISFRTEIATLYLAHQHRQQHRGNETAAAFAARIGVAGSKSGKRQRHVRKYTEGLETESGNHLAQREMRETLRQALARLSPKLREAVQMRYLDGFSMRETASALGISTNALKSRVARGRATLSLLLHEITAANQAAEPAAGPALLQAVE